MKKIISLVLTMVLIISGLFIFTGCGEQKVEDKKESSEAKKDEKVATITYEMGKGVVSLSVPKKADGTPKYEFVTTKPEGMKQTGAFYLTTDTCFIAFSSSGLSYNTSKDYKAKYGDTKATFDGYLEFINDESSTINLAGMEQFEINGRKALRYYNRVGPTGEYRYWGYFYLVAADDIYPGSKFEMTINYNAEEKPTEAQEFDTETLEIINSLKIELKK